jgi:hypothetical protein
MVDVELELAKDGAAVVRGVLSPEEVGEWIRLLGTVDGAGRRGLLAHPAVAALAGSERLKRLARPCLAGPPLPVRGILFDKSPGANWLVPWHQDLTIAVRERIEAEGFSAWSTKDGIPHVQPPVALLERMLAIRLHLDAADETNGALRIIPGTHRLGKLDAEEIALARAERSEQVCCVEAGDAVLMRPLVLHASAKAISPQHRRVLHLEYAGFDLPPGMAWHSSA